MFEVKSKILLAIICQFLAYNFLSSPPMLAPEASEQEESDLKVRLMPLGSGGGRGPKDKKRPTLRIKRHSEDDPLPFGLSVIPKSKSPSPRLDSSKLLEDFEVIKKVKIFACAHLNLENLPKESWFGLLIEKKLDIEDGRRCHVYKIKCCCKQICLADFPQRCPTYRILDIPVGKKAYYAIKLPKNFNFNGRAFGGGTSVTIESMRDFPLPWFCIIPLG